MNFKPIKTKKISDKIIEQIKQMIAEGKLKPGDKLVSERELAERMQVSRASVREALTALELMGLIEIRPGEGTHIKKTTGNDIITPLSMILFMEKDSHEDVLEVRKVLEVSCARMAAARRTQSELEDMEKALALMEKSISNKELGAEADVKFHFSVAVASHNTLLVRLMNTVSDSIKENLRENRELLFATVGTPERLVAEHFAIYQAIRDKDSKKAAEHMYYHLDRVAEEMLK